jgi:hypothetical protein
MRKIILTGSIFFFLGLKMTTTFNLKNDSVKVIEKQLPVKDLKIDPEKDNVIKRDTVGGGGTTNSTIAPFVKPSNKEI